MLSCDVPTVGRDPLSVEIKSDLGGGKLLHHEQIQH